MHQMLECFRRGRNVDLVRCEKEQVAPEIIQDPVEQDHGHDPDPERIQRGKSLMHDHLVHHDLEKERGNQRDQGHHHDQQRDLEKDPLQLDEFGKEPEQAERLILVGQLVEAFEEQSRSRVFFLKFVRPDEAELPLLGRFGRIQDGDRALRGILRVLAPAAEHGVFPIALDAEHRIRLTDPREFFPSDFDFFRDQAVVGRHLLQFEEGGFLLPERIFMQETPGIHGDLMMSRDRGQAEKAGKLPVVHRLQIPEDQELPVIKRFDLLFGSGGGFPCAGDQRVEQMDRRRAFELSELGDADPAVVFQMEQSGSAVHLRGLLQIRFPLGTEFQFRRQSQKRIARGIPVFLPDSIGHQRVEIDIPVQIDHEAVKTDQTAGIADGCGYRRRRRGRGFIFHSLTFFPYRTRRSVKSGRDFGTWCPSPEARCRSRWRRLSADPPPH